MQAAKNGAYMLTYTDSVRFKHPIKKALPVKAGKNKTQGDFFTLCAKYSISRANACVQYK